MLLGHEMQDHPWENIHSVYDTKTIEVNVMGEEPKGPWECRGGRWCACLRETIKTLHKDNDVQVCPHEESFHGSGPQGFLPFLNCCSIYGSCYFLLPLMMMIGNYVY